MAITPGPWMAYKEPNGEISICTKLEDGTCGPWIATVIIENLDAEDTQQADNDAVLIAAAPDLFSALVWLTDDLAAAEEDRNPETGELYAACKNALEVLKPLEKISWGPTGQAARPRKKRHFQITDEEQDAFVKALAERLWPTIPLETIESIFRSWPKEFQLSREISEANYDTMIMMILTLKIREWPFVLIRSDKTGWYVRYDDDFYGPLAIDQDFHGLVTQPPAPPYTVYERTQLCGWAAARIG